MSEILTRLSIQSAKIGDIGHSTSSADITVSDICAALGPIKNGVQYHLIMIRFADQWPNKGETELIIQEIQNMVVSAWLRGRGSDRFHRGKIRPLAEAAWVETIGNKMTQNQLAKFVGMSQPWWARHAQKIYVEVRKEIESTYSDGLALVRQQLF